MGKIDYTETQKRQLRYLDSREAYESLAYLNTYDVSCKDCNERVFLHSVDGCKSFIHLHAGHRTWIIHYLLKKEG